MVQIWGVSERPRVTRAEVYYLLFSFPGFRVGEAGVVETVTGIERHVEDEEEDGKSKRKPLLN